MSDDAVQVTREFDSRGLPAARQLQFRGLRVAVKGVLAPRD